MSYRCSTLLYVLIKHCSHASHSPLSLSFHIGCHLRQKVRLVHFCFLQAYLISKLYVKELFFKNWREWKPSPQTKLTAYDSLECKATIFFDISKLFLIFFINFDHKHLETHHSIHHWYKHS